MAATSSVFAKQLAGRVPQKAGPVTGHAGGQRAGAVNAAVAKNSSAATARPKAGVGTAHTTALKSSVVVAPKASKPLPEDETGGEGGDVVTCANRGLLQQLLESVEEEGSGGDGASADGHSEDGRDGQNPFEMSLRLVANTPKAGTKKKTVPTISSPSVSKPKPPITASLHKVAAAGPPPAPIPKVSTATTKVLSSHSSAPVITTGPPQSINVASVSGPRPGSRGASGGGAPQQVLTPSHQKVGTPGLFSRATNGGRAGGYAGIHAGRAKQPNIAATCSPMAKPAPKPLCGPRAFDMLRQMDKAQAKEPQEDENDPDGGFDVGNDGSNEADDPNGDFMMPPDSDNESEPPNSNTNAIKHTNVSSANMLGRPRPSALGSAAPSASGPPVSNQVGSGAVSSTNNPSNAGIGNKTAPGAQESAAEYVERVKRGMGVEMVGPPVNVNPGSAVRAQSSAVNENPGSAVRAQSSDARHGARSDRGFSPAALRVRSSDPRAAVAAAKAAEPSKAVRPAGDIDDDSDDEGPTQFGAGAVAWKANVRSIVRDFAQEERGRASPPPGDAVGNSDRQMPRGRPPKAPPPTTAAPVQAMPAPVTKINESEDNSAGNRENQQAEPNPGEELIYSRKPRAVEYEPATVDKYKNKYGKKGEYNKLGTLGPDLDDEELLMKKAQQMRKKQYCSEVQKLNSHRSGIAKEKPPKPEPKPEPKANARSKAMEFAKQLPRPKPEPKPVERKVREATPEPSTEDLERADLEEIERREQQHFEDVAKVRRIREALKMVEGN